MALLLGPSGFGLFGLYGSIADLTQNIAGLGVNSSGVRQIAEAAGSGDEERMARTAAILRRTSLVLGILGAVLLAILQSRWRNSRSAIRSARQRWRFCRWQFCCDWCPQAREL